MEAGSQQHAAVDKWDRGGHFPSAGALIGVGEVQGSLSCSLCSNGSLA